MELDRRQSQQSHRDVSSFEKLTVLDPPIGPEVFALHGISHLTMSILEATGSLPLTGNLATGSDGLFVWPINEGRQLLSNPDMALSPRQAFAEAAGYARFLSVRHQTLINLGIEFSDQEKAMAVFEIIHELRATKPFTSPGTKLREGHLTYREGSFEKSFQALGVEFTTLHQAVEDALKYFGGVLGFNSSFILSNPVTPGDIDEDLVVQCGTGPTLQDVRGIFVLDADSFSKWHDV